MGTSNTKAKCYIYLLIGHVIFGFSFLLSTIGLSVADLYVLLAARFLVAFVVMNLILLSGKVRINLKNKNIKALLLLGVIQPVLYFIFELSAVNVAPTSFVGTLISLIPIVTLVLGMIFLKEKARPVQIIFALISVCGVFLTTMNQGEQGTNIAGFLFSMGAVFASGFFNIISRKISGEFSAFERTYVMFAVGTVAFLTIAIMRSLENPTQMLLVPLTSIEFWISIIFLAVLSSVVAFMMINYALTHVSAGMGGIFANIVTVISILAGVIILGEEMGLNQVIGSVIIIVSVYMVIFPPKLKSKITKNEE